MSKVEPQARTSGPGLGDGPAESEIRAVVLDFGGVVVDWDMRHLFRKVFADEAQMEYFLAHVLTQAENHRCDAGVPLAQVVAETSERHPEYAHALEAWRDRWIETVPAMIPGAEELVDDLRAAGYLVLGLSNFSAETFPMCRAGYPVFERFDDIVISGDVGVAKPGLEIYLLLCERNGIEPGQAVFLDDSPVNVDGALAVGMQALHFTDTRRARAALADLGVLMGRE
jgi:2-haloacid dehalogenase